MSTPTPPPPISPSLMAPYFEQPRFKGLSAREIHSELLADSVRKQNAIAYAEINARLEKRPNWEPPGEVCVIL